MDADAAGCALATLADPAKLPPDAHCYDVTLRDGAQAPGVEFTRDQRREIAGLIDDAGVAYIEAGYPGRDGAADIAPVCEAVDRATVVGLADASTAAVDAVLSADLPAVSIFAGGSPIHRARTGDGDLAELEARVGRAVAYAVDHDLEVRFAVTDAGRTEPATLDRLLERGAAAGADMLGLTDTVGILTPRVASAAVAWIRDRHELPVSVHCHDDLGMAVGNTVAALEAGASQAHVTVNGLGPGAGNTPLAPVATALSLYHDRSVCDLDALPGLSERVAEASGQAVPPGAPIVGRNAFKYVVPARAARVREDPRVYEGFPPSLVGRTRRIESDE